MNNPEQYLFILGSHPALSVAEVVSYFKRKGLEIKIDENFLPKALLVSFDNEIDARKIIKQLGGVPVIEKIIGSIKNSTENLSADYVLKLPDFLELKNRKIKNLGISWSSLTGSVDNRQVKRLGMELKKKLKIPGLRVVFPSRRNELSSAELYNNNFPDSGIAIHTFESRSEFYIAKLEAVQDIGFYTSRDRLRPKVDPGSGMMPVKLSQMMVNFSETPEGGIIYDPFCGTGTILMESLLMGYDVTGSDASDKQVERTRENLKWLKENFPGKINLENEKLFVADVVKLSAMISQISQNSFDAVVSEGWLGPALIKAPSPRDIEQIFNKVEDVVLKMLTGIKQPLKIGGHVVISLPAFKLGKRIVRFDAKKRLAKKGYVFVSLLPENLSHPIFRDSASGSLLYGRPDAIVLRDIVRLDKIS